MIGTLATGAGMPVDVVTGDRDLFQLVDDEAGVRVLYIARGVGRHERVTDAVVRDKYGVEPHQYADFATLRGDASDGLPGVAGVGREDRGHPAPAVRRHRRASWRPRTTPTPTWVPVRAARSRRPRDYLAVAPEVVAVARDLDLGELRRHAARHAPPTTTGSWSSSERWGLGLPAAPGVVHGDWAERQSSDE